MRYELNLAMRYALAILLILFKAPVYYIVAPLTLYASYFILKLFVPATLEGIKILTGKGTFVFIEACVATLAYILLAILILSTKDLSIRKSISLFLHGSLLIFIVNLFRIEFLIYAFFTGGDFAALHLFFWQFVSTLLVFFVWVYLIRKYHVKTMPVISDILHLLKAMKK